MESGGTPPHTGRRDGGNGRKKAQVGLAAKKGGDGLENEPGRLIYYGAVVGHREREPARRNRGTGMWVGQS